MKFIVTLEKTKIDDDDDKKVWESSVGKFESRLLGFLLHSLPILRGGIKKKNCFFFRKTPKGGEGGLAESKISLSEKTEIFLEFFLQRGGGLTYSKRVLS